MTVKELKDILEEFKDEDQVILELASSDDCGRYDPIQCTPSIAKGLYKKNRHEESTQAMLILSDEVGVEVCNYELLYGHV